MSSAKNVVSNHGTFPLITSSWFDRAFLIALDITESGATPFPNSSTFCSTFGFQDYLKEV